MLDRGAVMLPAISFAPCQKFNFPFSAQSVSHSLTLSRLSLHSQRMDKETV